MYNRDSKGSRNNSGKGFVKTTAAKKTTRGGDNDRAPRKSSSPYNSDRPKTTRRGDDDRAPRKTSSYSSDKPRTTRRNDDDRAPRKTSSYNSDRPRTTRSNDDNRAPRRTSSFSSDRTRAPRRNDDDRPRTTRSNDDNRSPRKTSSYGSDRTRAPRRTDDDRTPRKRPEYSSDKPASTRRNDDDRAPRKTTSYSSDRTRAPRRTDDERPPRRTSSYDSDRPSYGKPPRRGEDDRAPRKPREDGTLRSRSGRGPYKSDIIAAKKKAEKDDQPQTGNIRLNRFIANAGICSRREADELITAGLVTVNGVHVTEMGYQVKPTDEVKYNGERLSREKKVYLLLNKPKDAITTAEDPEGRRTVMELFGNELGERIYPVGRLDRNTTGVLLFTNDGDLAQRLMHPRYEMTKVYKASLDKVFKGEDMWTLQNGVELEDGFIKPDAVAYPDAKNKSEVGIEIHSGKNHIIHRIFEHLGYKVDKLDRVLYAGMTKGKLKRGEWKHLTEKELLAVKRAVKLS